MKFKNNTQEDKIWCGQLIQAGETFDVKDHEGRWTTDSQVAQDVASGDLIQTITIISARQLRLALLSQEITNQMILDAISQLSEPYKSRAEIGWEYSIEFDIENADVVEISGLLGMTLEQMEDLWRLAYTF